MTEALSAKEELVLIERVKMGERAGFDILVSLYQQKGLNIAFSVLGNIEDSKDALQEAFVKVYLNIAKFEAKSKFSTWFYRIVVNCSLDLLRKKKTMGINFRQIYNEGEEGERAMEIPDTRFDPATECVNKDISSKVDECIARLPEKQKVCFTLKHKNNLKTQEIAQVLKCSPATVKVHIYRAAGNLRKRLFYLAP